jgi:hypothetical protein
MLTNSVEKLAENVQEMCANGASVSDLIYVLEPYFKAKQAEIERGWIENPDRMGGQFTDEEINNTWL